MEAQISSWSILLILLYYVSFCAQMAPFCSVLYTKQSLDLMWRLSGYHPIRMKDNIISWIWFRLVVSLAARRKSPGSLNQLGLFCARDWIRNLPSGKGNILSLFKRIYNFVVLIWIAILRILQKHLVFWSECAVSFSAITSILPASLGWCTKHLLWWTCELYIVYNAKAWCKYHKRHGHVHCTLAYMPKAKGCTHVRPITLSVCLSLCPKKKWLDQKLFDKSTNILMVN